MNLGDPGLLSLPPWISVASIEWVPNFRNFFFSSTTTSNFIKNVGVNHIKWLNLPINNEKLTNLEDPSLLSLVTWIFRCTLYILARHCVCLLLSLLWFLYCWHPWFVAVFTFLLPVHVSVPIPGSSALLFVSALSLSVPGLSIYFLIFYCICKLLKMTWSIVDRKADEFRKLMNLGRLVSLLTSPSLAVAACPCVCACAWVVGSSVCVCCVCGCAWVVRLFFNFFIVSLNQSINQGYLRRVRS